MTIINNTEINKTIQSELALYKKQRLLYEKHTAKMDKDFPAGTIDIFLTDKYLAAEKENDTLYEQQWKTAEKLASSVAALAKRCKMGDQLPKNTILKLIFQRQQQVENLIGRLIVSNKG